MSHSVFMPRTRIPTRFEDLIAAATSVFLRTGYRRAQMADIAREMDVAPGTIYLYVESKEALFDLALRVSLDPSCSHRITLPVPTRQPEEILAFVSDQLNREAVILSLEKALRSRAPADSAKELEGIVRECYTKASRRWLALKLMETSALDWPELASLWFGGHRLRLLGQLTEYLRKRMKSGRLRASPDPAIAARLILEMIAAFALHVRTEPDESQPPQMIAQETVIDAIVRAFRKDAAANPSTKQAAQAFRFA